MNAVTTCRLFQIVFPVYTFFIILGDISISLICQKRVGLTISLSVHAYNTTPCLKKVAHYI